MRIGFALGVCILTAVPLFAQAPVPVTAPVAVNAGFPQFPPPPEPIGPPIANRPAFNDPVIADFGNRLIAPDLPRLWLRAEFLAWWVKDAPLPISLVSSGNTNNPGGELLNSDRNYGTLGGGRIGMGGWLDANNYIGLDANFFFLAQHTNNFFVGSNGNGYPSLAFPFFNQTPGQIGEMVMPITSPGQWSGNVQVASTLSLGGAEANATFCLLRGDRFEFTTLAGFRFLNLQENLNITSVSYDLTTSPSTITILDDRFSTTNRFYGGQIGSRFTWQSASLIFDVAPKVAFGSTNEVVNINGSSSQFGPTQPNGVFPGGFFTQPSNIGQISASHFTVVPSVEMKVQLLFSQRFRMFVGYDFLYWSQVVRPGNEVNRNINLTQSAILGSTNGVLSGPASPMPLMNRSDFWAQGMNVGFEYRY